MGNSYRHFAYFCHAELADLRTLERSENRLSSRLSLLEQSSLGESLRAWSKSKTVSGSGQCWIPARIVGQIPNQVQHDSYFLRFRFVPLLAHAIQNDNYRLSTPQ